MNGWMDCFYELTVLFLGDMTAATVFSPVVANETSRAYQSTK